MPPEPLSFVANVDAALVQQVFDVAEDRGNRMYIITAGLVVSGDGRKMTETCN